MLAPTPVTAVAGCPVDHRYGIAVTGAIVDGVDGVRRDVNAHAGRTRVVLDDLDGFFAPLGRLGVAAGDIDDEDAAGRADDV
jgi:hypothetical protein